MLDNVIIGQYVETGSVFHRMDAGCKIILTIAFVIVLFCLNQWQSYAAVTVLLAVIVAVSKIPIKMLLKGLKPIIMILIFTSVINLFAVEGEYIWSVNIGRFTLGMTYEGAAMAAFVAVRLIYLIVMTSMLTLTTTPLMLTDGIEKLLSPLKKIKVPAHEIAMMMSIALRFIPTLAEEADKIIKAQKARGADFESGSIINRAKAMIPVLVPLFVSAFRRADELATAMEARCYNGGDNRTKMNRSYMKGTDWIVSAAFAVCMAAVVLIENIV